MVSDLRSPRIASWGKKKSTERKQKRGTSAYFIIYKVYLLKDFQCNSRSAGDDQIQNLK